MKILKVLILPLNLFQKFGFSKIEICIAVTLIIFCLFFSCLKLSSISDSANETVAKQNLSLLRVAIADYYNDNNGALPGADITKQLVGKHLSKIPELKIKHHPKTNKILIAEKVSNDDNGRWVYKPSDGTIYINCSHRDSQGNVWNSL